MFLGHRISIPGLPIRSHFGDQPTVEMYLVASVLPLARIASHSFQQFYGRILLVYLAPLDSILLVYHARMYLGHLVQLFFCPLAILSYLRFTWTYWISLHSADPQ